MYRSMETDSEDRELLTKSILRQQEFKEREETSSAEGAGRGQPDPFIPSDPFEAAEARAEVQEPADQPAVDIDVASDLLEGNKEMHGQDNLSDVAAQDEMYVESDEGLAVPEAPAASHEPLRGESRPREDQGGDDDEGPAGPKRKRSMGDEFNEFDDKLLHLKESLNHVDMKKILEDLERDPRMQILTGNHRQRRSARQAIARGVVAEVYSPPRVADALAGWA